MRLRRPATPARDGARPSEERSLTAEPRFIGSFPRADVSLSPALAEVALVGRSNVGKSSLLNALAGRKIAKTSGTPGKTRMMNVYEMPLVRDAQYAVADGADRASDVPGKQLRTAHRALYLLDLPGYGYARASHTDRRAFRLLVTHALARPPLTGVLWLLDLRRDPSVDDRTIQDLLAERETRVLAALTKSDTLARSLRERRARELRDALHLDDDQMIVTSAREGTGIAELREAMGNLIQPRTA